MSKHLICFVVLFVMFCFAPGNFIVLIVLLNDQKSLNKVFLSHLLRRGSFLTNLNATNLMVCSHFLREASSEKSAQMHDFVQ